MSILISPMSIDPKDFTDEQNAALDEVSFFLSSGNWNEHLEELFGFNHTAGDTIEIAKLRDAAVDYVRRKAPVVEGGCEFTSWHSGIANRLIGMCSVAEANGADAIGVAG